MQDLKAIRFIAGTKVSHDYEGDHVEMFSYRDLWQRGVPAIGIPCKQNKLLIVDVDVEGASHKKDGTEFWARFSQDYSIPKTYTVRTRSGGYHFYFRLPESINPDTFSPPSQLSPGCDIKWNGWVGAPPSEGYSVEWGTLLDIAEVPVSLLAYISSLIKGGSQKTFDSHDPKATLSLARPFTPKQIEDLKFKIEWLQSNGTLSRAEWRDGLFALKAGIDDPELLDELICKYTMNRSYVPGDEEEARSIVAKAAKYGPIKPGSILAILDAVRRREGAPTVETPFTMQEILDKSKVIYSHNKDGKLVVECSESNAAALIGAIFTPETLYHDVRTDLYIFKGRSCSDSDIVNSIMPIIQSPAFGLGFDKFRKASVSAGLDILMASRRKDPHQDYLNSLHWDGIARIEKFFSHYVGTEDTPYTRKVGKNFWVSLAARGLNPGCKFDSMVVLEGHEGIMKSSLVEAIGGGYTFSPSNKDNLDNLDILRQMHQSVIVELPELMGLVNESSEKVKAFLAKPFDFIRALFAKKAMKALRGFVFFGTTNSDRYLTAAMGIRRFWPIKIPLTVESINLNAIKSDRDQLFAEAIAYFKDGYAYWEMPKEYLDAIVATKIVDEPLIGPVRNAVESISSNTWTTSDVYLRLEAQNFVTKGFDLKTVTRIEGALRRLGHSRTSSDTWARKKEIVFETPSMLDSLI